MTGTENAVDPQEVEHELWVRPTGKPMIETHNALWGCAVRGHAFTAFVFRALQRFEVLQSRGSNPWVAPACCRKYIEGREATQVAKGSPRRPDRVKWCFVDRNLPEDTIRVGLKNCLVQ